MIPKMSQEMRNKVVEKTQDYRNQAILSSITLDSSTSQVDPYIWII